MKPQLVALEACRYRFSRLENLGRAIGNNILNHAWSQYEILFISGYKLLSTKYPNKPRYTDLDGVRFRQGIWIVVNLECGESVAYA
jgi:hypothetical protein